MASDDILGLPPGHHYQSFTDYLRAHRPDLLPRAQGDAAVQVTHATTILALRFADGVVMAGDRRATEGYTIAHRGMEKVFPTDGDSAVGISGAAGPSIELVRLFQVELEYYEKVAGETLSLDGRANHLGRLIRGNLPAAMQGFVVLPLFAGYDRARKKGRIFRYDVTGGRYEEADYHATGSGGPHAKNTLKKLFRSAEEIDRQRAVRMALEALADAAEEDVGTAGPDPVHGIYPTVHTLTTDGVRAVPDEETERVSNEVLDDRRRISRTGSGDLPSIPTPRED